MVTLCIYYGEKEWDGPLSLVDMLDIPDKLKLIFLIISLILSKCGLVTIYIFITTI